MVAGDHLRGVGESIASEALPVLVPLDAQAAADATMNSGLGALIQYVLLMLTIALSIGGLLMIGAAGLARLSQDSGRQGNVTTYLASAVLAFGIAMVLGAGPEILSALGMQTFEHVSPVRVFGG